MVSLYNNIFTDFGISLIEKFLSENRHSSEKPSNDMLLKLLEFVLTLNEFEFNGEYFLQLFGTAIGTRVAPSYANLVVAIFENLYVYTYSKPALLWYRFIDDIFGYYDGTLDELQLFVKHLNSQVESLKFTLEYSETSISFLDVTVTKQKDNSICTDLFRKPTDARNYLMFDSAHPHSCKKGIPYGQFLRVRRICSTLEIYDKRALEMAQSFLARGYPQELVETAVIRARRRNRDELLASDPSPKTEKGNTFDSVFLIRTFTPGSDILGKIIESNAPILTKNPKFRDFDSVQIQKVFRRPKNLKDLLVRATVSTTVKHKESKRSFDKKCKSKATCRYCPQLDKTGRIKSTVSLREYQAKNNINCQSHNLIYCITCKSCGKQYVGQTGRRIIDRFQGHFGLVAKGDKSTLINDHFNKQDHNGIKDMIIHVLDFIHAGAKTDTALALRLRIEAAWIHRLQSAFPLGLNYLD